MKWVCLMANMAVPGVGSMIARRFIAGAIQTIGSIAGFAMFGYCVYVFYHATKDYAESMGSEVDSTIDALKGLGDQIIGPPLIIGGVGVLILKVTWIWAQVTTAQVFKAEKAAQEEVEAERPADSSN